MDSFHQRYTRRVYYPVHSNIPLIPPDKAGRRSFSSRRGSTTRPISHSTTPPEEARGSKSRVRLQGVTLGRSLEPRRSPWPPNWRARLRPAIHPRRNSGVGRRYPGLACVRLATRLPICPTLRWEACTHTHTHPTIFRLAIPE